MSNLFKNEYRVFLYKYNYNKLKDVVSDKFADATSGSAYQYLFESFITDLYSLGIPSDEIRKDYQKFYKEYAGINNKVDEKKLKQSQKSGYTVTTYKPNDTSLVDKDTNINAYRSPKTPDDNILQEALAQNYALQKLQQNYEDTKMMNGDTINWLNTKQDKIAYEQGLKSALAKSKELLNSLFDPVIDDIVNIRQSGKTSSDYVYCIELTDLSSTPYLDVPITERTKNSCDKFLNSKVSNRLISDDLRTNALADIGTIKTDLTQITNMTSFTLRQDILLKYNIDIEPNDVIEIISTNYNKAINYTTYDEENKDPLNRNTQFLGFVTQLSLSNKYGQVSDLTVICEGISKLLTMNPVVSENAVSPQFNNLLDFIAQPKKNPSDATTVNVYVTQYNNSTVYELFTDIMSKVLASSPIEGDTTNYTVRYVSDPKKLKGLQYQYCKPLIVLYHLAASISTVRQCGPTEVIIAKVDCNILQTKLQAYLKQLRTNFTNFWSTYASPIQILNAIVENSFLEIYEDRCGVLIMRTPRYNTWLGKDIIDMHDIIEWSQTINDVSLKSRSDYQYCINYLGTMRDFPGGAYENIPALLKYGFRADSPKTSPNAKNQKLCAVFGALDVARSNSKTRILKVTVPMIQDYVLGKLYYLPIQDKNSVDGLQSVGCVGYLSSITSNINPGNVDQHVLEFTYVRNAELLDNDPSITENYGNILNFNHLPDLEMMMNLFTEEDIEQPAKTDTSDKNKSSGLPSQYYYYWAAYQGPYKKTFDDYVAGNSVGTITAKERKYFDISMAPTVLTKSSFQSYKNGSTILSNASYVPSQQLINDIWYIDMCLRYNVDIANNISTSNKMDYYESKILRSKTKIKDYDFKEKFLEYMERDATFNAYALSLPDYIENDLGNYYAKVGNFFINASLIPSMLQPVNQDGTDSQLDRLNNFMSCFIQSYNYINAYDDASKVNFVNTYISSKSNETNKNKIEDFNRALSDLKEIIDEYHEFQNNDYNFLNLYYKLYINLNTDQMKYKSKNNRPYVIGMFTDYYKTKKSSELPIFLTNNKPSLNKTLGENFITFFDFKVLNDYLTYTNSKALEPIFTNKKQQPVQHLIPAVVLNGHSLPPLRIFNDFKYGAFLAGISSVDYNTFFEEIISPVIKENINSKITLEDNSFRNAKNEVIGKIQDLVFDPNMSSDLCLYYYPVIKFNTDAYSEYMTTKADLQSFVDTGVAPNDKKVASVIVISPTQIPESKILTIQQIALQKGLYVGKWMDGSFSVSGNDLNIRAAIFDPSVLYKWTRNELNNTYTATIYNLINNVVSCKTRESFSKFNTVNINFKALIKSNTLQNVPCVFNTSLNFNKLPTKIFTHDSIETNITKIFNRIEKVNTQNTFFSIKKIDGTNYYQLEDTVSSLQEDSIKNTAKSIILNFTNDTGVSKHTTEKYKSPHNIMTASVGNSVETLSNTFSDYVRSREDVHANLYTDNHQNSTIFYQNMDKYPTKVRRTSGVLAFEALSEPDLNY